MNFLVENSYSEAYLSKTSKCIKLVLEVGVSPEIASYEELFNLEIKKRGYKSKGSAYKAFKTAIGNIKLFDEENIYPRGKSYNNGFLAPLSLYDKLSGIFKSAIDYHLKIGGQHGKQEKTVTTESYAAIKFFNHLQHYGAETFQEVENRMVYAFFFDGERQIRGKAYCDSVKAVLKVIMPLFGTPILKTLEMLPAVKSRHKNFQFLTQEESIKIRECLEKDDSGLTHRDRSIGWLLFFFGLRGTDIINLKFENIDWKHDQIHLVQSKTGESLSLPMNAAIGNELFYYITTERPKNATTTVLLTESRSHGKLRILGDIVRKIFEKAGVRTGGGSKGVRVLRHHLVTYLLSHGIKCDIVSSVVGHRSPESLKPYADTDIEHLRECSISIAAYPLNSKLFGI